MWRRHGKSTRTGRVRRLARASLLLTCAALAATAGAVALLRLVDPPTTAFMLQRQWQARSEGRGDFALRQRWMPIASLPAHVALAAVSAEDQRFFEHRGFDLTEMKHAFGSHLQGAELRGASTITQQVAKNLFLWEGRSFARKALEGYFTLLIELCWSKRRILEVYLNIAELGDGVFGVGAAAQHHFGRDARRLTAAQSALLAAILPDPRGRSAREPSAQVRRKQRWILQQMRALRGRQPSLHGASAHVAKRLQR
jgi:monofunctional biosynthetic peptidoglycan transglycosylase